MIVTPRCDHSELRVLFLAVNLKGWTAQNIAYFQEAIQERMPASVFYGPGFRYNTNFVPEIINETFPDSQPDAIFCFVSHLNLLGNPMPEAQRRKYGVPDELKVFPVGLDKVNVPKVMWITDFWQSTKDEWDRVLLDNGFRYAFSTCCPPFGSRKVFRRFFSSAAAENVRFVPWPHAVPHQVFKDYGLSKTYDVACLGMAFEDFYPLRTLMYRRFAHEPGLQCLIHGHPGYEFLSPKDAIVGESYAKALNQSRILATCTGIYGVPFQKIFEAMMCKAVVLSDRPYGAEYLGLLDRHNYLSVDDTNFVEVAKYYLARPSELERLARNAYELVTSQHTVEVRAGEFCYTLGELLAGNEPDGWAALFSANNRTDNNWYDIRDFVVPRWGVFRRRKWRWLNKCLARFKNLVSRLRGLLVRS
jgi:hypothetical protein